MFVVCVTIKVEPDAMAKFLPIMQEQAHNSLTLEAECHQFDVSCAVQGLDEVFLYEVYSNAAAFDAHLETPHFQEFDATVAPLIRSKTIATYTRL